MRIPVKGHYVWVNANKIMLVTPTVDEEGRAVVGNCDIVMDGGSVDLTCDQGYDVITATIEEALNGNTT